MANGNGNKAPASVPPRAGRWLLIWMGLIIALEAMNWLSGSRGAELARAVEAGTARAESVRIGEVGDEVIRKAIRTQQTTLPFWTAVSVFGDFVFEPLAPALRTILVATCFAAVAALAGRPPQFDEGLVRIAQAQGIWVLRLAMRVGMMLALQRPEVETSATLFLDAGAYPAAAWVALGQLDFFVLIGWLVIVRGGWRSGQVNLLTGCLIAGAFWALEAASRIGYVLVLGAWVRLAVLPS